MRRGDAYEMTVNLFISSSISELFSRWINNFSKLSSKSLIKLSFCKFPEMIKMSLYGTFFKINELKKSLSLVITILFSFMERFEMKSSSVRFLSIRSKVWILSYPFSLNHLESLLGRLASTINFKRLYGEYFLPEAFEKQIRDRHGYLLFLNLHNLLKFHHRSYQNLINPTSIQLNNGDFVW